MAQFTVNPSRFDPYKSFRFQVRWDGRVVAGVSRVSPMARRTEVVEHREGGDPSVSRRSPGRTSYAPVTFERGVTHDPAFEQWANLVHRFGGDPEVTLADFRKDLVVDLMNEAGQVALSYVLHRCWVSAFQALPELDANGEAVVAIERITVEHEGWERDTSVPEPVEPGSSSS